MPTSTVGIIRRDTQFSTLVRIFAYDGGVSWAYHPIARAKSDATLCTASLTGSAAKERALELAQGYKCGLQALSFLVAWPSLDRAAALVIRRAGDLDGNHYEILGPAADALAGRHPLAATLLLRSMIDFALSNGRSTRYRQGAPPLGANPAAPLG